MPWGHAKSVVRKALSAIGWLGFSRTKSAADMSGPAQITGPKSRTSGELLTARAYRLHNRKDQDAKRYIAVHQSLSRGR